MVKYTGLKRIATQKEWKRYLNLKSRVQKAALVRNVSAKSIAEDLRLFKGTNLFSSNDKFVFLHIFGNKPALEYFN